LEARTVTVSKRTSRTICSTATTKTAESITQTLSTERNNCTMLGTWLENFRRYYGMKLLCIRKDRRSLLMYNMYEAYKCMRYLHTLPIGTDKNARPPASVRFHHNVLIAYEKLIVFIKCEVKKERYRLCLYCIHRLNFCNT
jgi:hypothetical protein